MWSLYNNVIRFDITSWAANIFIGCIHQTKNDDDNTDNDNNDDECNDYNDNHDDDDDDAMTMTLS